MKGMNFNGDIDHSAQVWMMEAKMAAESAAARVEDLTGVRMVGPDETHFGQETRLMREAERALKVVADRDGRANAALCALVAWRTALQYRRMVKAHGRRGDMVRVWLARVDAVDAYLFLSDIADRG